MANDINETPNDVSLGLGTDNRKVYVTVAHFGDEPQARAERLPMPGTVQEEDLTFSVLLGPWYVGVYWEADEAKPVINIVRPHPDGPAAVAGK